jgi:hypothetical protein
MMAQQAGFLPQLGVLLVQAERAPHKMAATDFNLCGEVDVVERAAELRLIEHRLLKVADELLHANLEGGHAMLLGVLQCDLWALLLDTNAVTRHDCTGTVAPELTVDEHRPRRPADNPQDALDVGMTWSGQWIKRHLNVRHSCVCGVALLLTPGVIGVTEVDDCDDTQGFERLDAHSVGLSAPVEFGVYLIEVLDRLTKSTSRGAAGW